MLSVAAGAHGTVCACITANGNALLFIVSCHYSDVGAKPTEVSIAAFNMIS